MAQQTKNKDNERTRKDGDQESKMQHGSSTGIADTISSAAESATKAVGSGMESMAQQVDQRGPQEGVLGSANTMLSDTLEQLGQYLQREGLGGLSDDLKDFMQRYPVTAVCVGVGLGYVLGSCCPTSWGRGTSWS